MIHELDQKISAFYQSLDDRLSSTKRQFAVGCLSGCGKCCSRPNGVWATGAELIPMAQELLRRTTTQSIDELLEVISKAKATDSCPVFQRSEEESEVGFGRCGVYEKRPLICRLFGSSTRRGRLNKKEFIGCSWQKENFPEAIEKLISEDLPSDLDVDSTQWCRHFHFQFNDPGLHEEKPIAKALEDAVSFIRSHQYPSSSWS